MFLDFPQGGWYDITKLVSEELGTMMVTNLAVEFGKVLFRERLTRVNVCEAYNITSGSLSRLLHKPMPTPQLVDILDTLGWDVEVRFVKRGESE